MKKQHLNPQELSKPGSYSHVVAIRGGRRLVYVSGQVSWNREGAVEGRGDMRAQAERVFTNVTHALRAAGAGWSDVIKMNGYMVDMNAANVAAYREVRQRFVKGEPPASTLVGVTRLVHEDLLLEVEVVAALGAPAGGAGNAERQAKRAARQAQRKAERQAARKQGKKPA